MGIAEGGLSVRRQTDRQTGRALVGALACGGRPGRALQQNFAVHTHARALSKSNSQERQACRSAETAHRVTRYAETTNGRVKRYACKVSRRGLSRAKAPGPGGASRVVGWRPCLTRRMPIGPGPLPESIRVRLEHDSDCDSDCTHRQIAAGFALGRRRAHSPARFKQRENERVSE